MEIKHNPNSLRQDASSYWSDLPLDLLNLVFERLSFANFTRAKSVCSSWYSASRRSVPKNQIPWLILFPEDDNNNNNSCKLSNPEEKHKLYKTEDLGVEFTKSVCLATHGSWLLMRDPRYDFYIVNLFTHERIDLPSLDLPSLELQLGSIKIERVFDDLFRVSNDDYQREIKGMFIRSPVIWIDEKTKDYVVLWALWSWCVFYSKKGDTSWNMIPELSNCLHMVYKDHKLYFASFKNIFTILDFSGKIPQQTFQCATDLFRIEFGSSVRHLSNCWVVNETKLVVTVAGDVLKVQRMLKPRSRKQSSFRIFKIYSSLGFPKYEPVRSLGNEAMLFDLGVTVLVDEVEGLKRNSIYFSGLQGRKANTIYIFNFETRKMESLKKLDCSPVQLFGARWFLPSLKHT